MFVRQTVDGYDVHRHFSTTAEHKGTVHGTVWRVEPYGGGWAVRGVFVAAHGGHAPMKPEAYFCCEADAEAVAKWLTEPRPRRREWVSVQDE